jgi:hypothetical protein
MNEIMHNIFWKEINKVEEVATKLNSCQSILNICAANLTSDESGALWAASDILKDLESKLDNNVAVLMQIYKQSTPVVKKGKKK